MGSVLRMQRLSLPQQGDFRQGAGITTEQKTNAQAVEADVTFALPKVIVAPEAHNAPWAQPVPVWMGLLALLFVLKFLLKRSGMEAEYMRVGFGNLLVFFVMFVLVSNLGKWLFGYWRLPGISTLVLAA